MILTEEFMTFTTHPRFAPYSILTTSSSLIPFSTIICEIFPAHINLKTVIFNKEEADYLGEVQLNEIGPVNNFTCKLDLEKGKIEVSCFLLKGFFRYEIEAKEPSSILIKFLKVPKDTSISPEITIINQKTSFLERDGNKFSLDNFKKIEEKDVLVIETSSEVKRLLSRERLMLGSHKSQDVEMIKRRGDLAEILPIWFFLSQTINIPKELIQPSKDSLFSQLEKAVQKSEKEQIPQLLLNIFKTGFSSLFLPSFCNHSYLGLNEPCFSNNAISPLNFLSVSYFLIRSLFFREHDQHIEFLPVNPPQFHSGKLLNIETYKKHKISFEWSKKTVRRVVIEVTNDENFSFKFKSEIKSFRISSLDNKKEIKKSINKSEIFLQKGIYLLDKFEK